MQIIIDHANLDIIKDLYGRYPVNGVTTNPAIICRENADPMAQLKKIRALVPAEDYVFAQVVATTTDKMVEEGEYMAKEVGGNFQIKIPTTPEGYKAMRILAEGGYHVTATSIFNPMQALLAAKMGAEYVAPYVNKISCIGGDGVQVACEIHDMLKNYNLPCKVVGASFKNAGQVEALADYGVAAVTLNPDVMEMLYHHPGTTEAVAGFTNDFDNTFGKGKNMLSF